MKIQVLLGCYIGDVSEDLAASIFRKQGPPKRSYPTVTLYSIKTHKDNHITL